MQFSDSANSSIEILLVLSKSCPVSVPQQCKESWKLIPRWTATSWSANQTACTAGWSSPSYARSEWYSHCSAGDHQRNMMRHNTAWTRTSNTLCWAMLLELLRAETHWLTKISLDFGWKCSSIVWQPMNLIHYHMYELATLWIS